MRPTGNRVQLVGRVVRGYKNTSPGVIAMTCSLRHALLASLLIGSASWAASQPANIDETRAAVARAQAFAETQQYEQVIATLEAIPVEKRDYDAHHLLGQAYYRAGRLAGARRNLRAAVRLNPNPAHDHYLLGDIYLAEDKSALAIESYTAAERLGLCPPELPFRMAAAYYNLGSYVGRLETRTLRAGVPGRLQGGVYVIGAAPNEAGRFLVAPEASAIYHLQRALDAGLDTPLVHLLHADIWLRARRYDRALRIYQALEEKVPAAEQARYYRHFAGACLATDDVEGYLIRLKQALAVTPKTDERVLADAYRRVAQHYNAAGDLDNYIHYLQLAVGLDPESADLHYCLGNAFDDAGRLQNASRHWRITLELQPDHPDRRRMLERVRDITAASRPER